MAMTALIRRHALRLAVTAIVVVSVGAMAWMALSATRAQARQQSALSGPAGSSAQVKRGYYLMRMGDCISCHTKPGGQPLAGGRAMATPFGTVYSTNITPDKATGIGSWTEKDFWRTLHDGVRKDGSYLYPTMPFTSYTKVTRKDADAIFAYLRSVKPIHHKNKPLGMPFPFNVRASMLGWRLMFFNKGVYKANPKKSDEWNRGAYLVEGLGHCTACHTQRNALGGTKSGRDMKLAGGMIPLQNWYAPNLSTAPNGGLEGWTTKNIVNLLKTGRSRQGAVYGPMSEVVQYSTQYVHKDDLRAIATYLQDMPSKKSSVQTTFTEPPDDQISRLITRGRIVYKKNCAECHQASGEGVPNVYPRLNGNASVLAGNPVNPIRMVLLGGFETPTKTYPRPYSMPPFAQKLDDHDVAAVVTYLRHAWDNNASAVSPKTVRKYRALTESP